MCTRMHKVGTHPMVYVPEVNISGTCSEFHRQLKPIKIMLSYDSLRVNPKQNTCKAFLRDYKILAYYRELRTEVEGYMPLLLDYLQESYYIDRIAKIYKITPSYISAKMPYLKSLTKEDLDEFYSIAKRCCIDQGE